MTDPSPQAGDEARRHLGFLSVADTAALAERGVHVLDPGSTLVAPGAEIGEGTVLYPTVVLAFRRGGRLAIDRDVQIWPGSSLIADGGTITVGPGAEIGDEGGFHIKASRSDVTIAIGARARLTGGGSLAEACHVGDGAQVLGRIAVRNCTLASGGDYNETDPDHRGAVLKGLGQARGLTLAQGRVIQGFGIFSPADEQWQSFYHPKPGP